MSLVGVTKPELGGSEYLAVVHGLEAGFPPVLDLKAELAAQGFVLEAIKRGLLASAHDCAEGGMAVAVAESAIAGKQGVDIAVDLAERADYSLFAESQSRIVVSFDEEQAPALTALAAEYDVPFDVIGTVGGDRVVMEVDGDLLIDLPLNDVVTAHTEPIYAAMGE